MLDIQTHVLSNPSLLHDLTSQPEYTQDLSPANAGATNGPQHICQSQHWRCRIEAPCLSSQATQQLCLRVYVLPPWKLTWQWKNHNILNGIYIFIWLFFHCHVSFQGGNWVARMIITRIIMSHDHNDCMKSSWDWSTMDTMQTDANCSKSEDCIMFIKVKHALHFYKYLNVETTMMVELQHPNIHINTTIIFLTVHCFITIHVADQTLRKISQSSPPLWEVLLDRVLKVERKPKASCPRKVDSSNAEKYCSKSREKISWVGCFFSRNLQQIKHVDIL